MVDHPTYHVFKKRDQFKRRDYMDRRVAPPKQVTPSRVPHLHVNRSLNTLSWSLIYRLETVLSIMSISSVGKVWYIPA